MINKTFGFGIALAVFLSLDGVAHTVVTLPPPRLSATGPFSTLGGYSNNETPPCGLPALPPAATYKAGQTITVNWEVTIHHLGFFQIFFSPTPAGNNTNDVYLSNGLNTYPGPANNPNPKSAITPLLTVQQNDNLKLAPPYLYSAQVTLPNTPTTAGTLQVVQVATDSGTANNVVFYYFTCADIALTSATASPTPAPSPAPAPSPTPTPTPTPAPATCASPTPAPVAATFTAVNSQIFQPRCVSCHTGGANAPGGLDLTTYNGVLGGVNTASPTSSMLYIQTINGTMPGNGNPLTSAQESLLLQWIQSGAPNN